MLLFYWQGSKDRIYLTRALRLSQILSHSIWEILWDSIMLSDDLIVSSDRQFNKEQLGCTFREKIEKITKSL